MFRKLKTRLVMINLISLSVVLAGIFIGIYLFMEHGAVTQSKMAMYNMARTERSSQPPEDRIPEETGSQKMTSECFYIRLDKNGQIIDISRNAALSQEDALNIADIAAGNSKVEGIFTYNNVTLRFLKAQKNYGTLLVLLDKDNEKSELERLILVSLMVGAVSFGVVFALSYYLANKAIIPVRDAWEKQKAFVADASHELRTPLAVIHTNMDIVMDSREETVESQSKWLENVEMEVKRMTRLVDDLLFLARADVQEEKAPAVEYNISRALEQAAMPFEPVAAEKRVRLDTKIEPGIMLHGNEDKTKQLTAILIDNAIKYTPQGGSVELGMRAGEEVLEITVSDTGEGISKEHLERIFVRFYRVDKSRSRNYGGSGLGLAIASCIVKECKGTIHVSSTVGKGTTFRIVLPR